MIEPSFEFRKQQESDAPLPDGTVFQLSIYRTQGEDGEMQLNVSIQADTNDHPLPALLELAHEVLDNTIRAVAERAAFLEPGTQN